MSGKLIMPKHTGQRTEFESVLKVHADNGGWITSSELKDLLHDEYVRLGKETTRKTDETDYTKDAQLPRYFGLIERPAGKELKNDAETRITDTGKSFYEALKNNEWETVHRLLVCAFSTLTFGRNTQGCGSDSDYEPIGVFFRAAYALEGLTNKEYGFLLAELDEKSRPLSDVLDEIKKIRAAGQSVPIADKSLASNLADAKTLVLLRELKFLSLQGDRNVVNPDVDAKFRVALTSLRIFNIPAMKDKFLAAIRTKPFILLAGISGTGKSRMVRQLARGCCPKGSPLENEQKPGNFEMIPVRPNWHDSSELLGYVSRVSTKSEYQLTAFVRFLARAWLFPDVPFFLCLDEMNLAPVEQYFAEYLSVIESRKRNSAGQIVTDVLVHFPAETIDAVDEDLFKKSWDAAWEGKIDSTLVQAVRDSFKADKGLRIPPNLVVMGTVNMDETTCSFSRKVLDRAMSFELNEVSMDEGLDKPTETDFGTIPTASATPTLLKPDEFYTANKVLCDKVIGYLKEVNKPLDGTPFKIAYRTRDEVLLYCVERTQGTGDLKAALDEATSMKILSRIEGDENRFKGFSLEEFQKTVSLELLKIDNDSATKADAQKAIDDDAAIEESSKRSPSLSKLAKMKKDLDNIGAVSFWE